MKEMLSLGAVIVAMSAGGAIAGDNLCGFNANQLSRGFTESVDTSTTNISRTIGNGRCQDATVTTTVVTCFNQNGVEMTDRSYSTDPVQSDWGSSYPPVNGACHY